MTVLTFPGDARPLVSVLMVTFGAWEWVERSLRALREHTHLPYELIVVDNASPDGTGARLAGMLAGATVVQNERNVGFGPATNQGALHAVGRFICLLNSDTLVRDGWLEPLVEVLESDSNVGAVVPSKVNLDGTLQEACSMLDRDGRVHMYGLGADPSDLRYLFRRRVEFGGAACMLIRRRLFLFVGGFDPGFEAAYFEDVDLCFAMAEAGADVIYEPRSRVCHVGGASGEVHQWTSHAARNHARFMRRWAHKLAERGELPYGDSSPHRVIATRDAHVPDRVLVIPDPEGDGAEAGSRLRRLAVELATCWPRSRVTLLLSGPADHPDAMLDAGVEVVSEPGDPTRWLDDRLFHYSAVIVAARGSRRFRDGLRRSQPQALLVYDVEADGDGSLRGPLDADALRAADALLCPGTSAHQRLQQLAPGTPAFVLAVPGAGPGSGVGGRPSEDLASVMSHLGAAPPPSA